MSRLIPPEAVKRDPNSARFLQAYGSSGKSLVESRIEVLEATPQRCADTIALLQQQVRALQSDDRLSPRARQDDSSAARTAALHRMDAIRSEAQTAYDELMTAIKSAQKSEAAHPRDIQQQILLELKRGHVIKRFEQLMSKPLNGDLSQATRALMTYVRQLSEAGDLDSLEICRQEAAVGLLIPGLMVDPQVSAALTREIDAAAAHLLPPLTQWLRLLGDALPPAFERLKSIMTYASRIARGETETAQLPGFYPETYVQIGDASQSATYGETPKGRR